MTWNPQPAVVSPPPPRAATRTRTHAGIALVLLLPALFATKILVLATEKGSQCLVRGGCTHFPVEAFGVLLAAVAVCFVVTMTAPEIARKPALAVQLLLEAVAAGLVLAYP